MTVRTALPLWCATKPILGLATAALVEQCGIEPHEPLDVLLPADLASLAGSISLASLLTHEAGLQVPQLSTVLTQDPANRPALLRAALAGSRQPHHPRRAYSEWASWALLDALVAAVTGQRAAAFLDERLAASGVDDIRHVLPDPDLEIGLWWGVREGRRPLPMLAHGLESQLALQAPAVGAAGSATGLGSWYQLLGRAMSGLDTTGEGSLFPTLPYLNELQRRRRPPSHDATFVADVGFALGLVHPYPPGSDGASTFGQSSWLGATFGYLDLDVGVAGAVVFNGVNLHALRDIEAARDDLMAVVRQELA